MTAEPLPPTAAADPAVERIGHWFSDRGWQPFPFQREAWAACRSGDSGLIHAPTGTGKTLAAWFGALLRCSDSGVPGSGRGPVPLQVLWITPLRALALDTTRQLAAVVEDLELPWRVERRTGDTPASQRQRQDRRLPSALVTTPESLSLLLSRPDARDRFATLSCVIVDEFHELLGSKRGVQLELCLSWLRSLRPDLCVWGVSATLGRLDQALCVLLGLQSDGVPRTGRLIRGLMPRAVQMRSLLPESMERFPWAGHLGLSLLPAVITALETERSTLLFTNTRAQAEQWYQALLLQRPDWLEQLALHHGSLDRALREQVEDWLRQGRLRCVVATSSLDLGVDFSPVEQVIQVGSPKSVARLLQRAGRSGHRPGAAAKLLFVPTHALELVELAAARQAWADGRIEARTPVENALDVLVQHLITLALGPGFRADEALVQVRSTHAYRHLSDDDWSWALAFIRHGGPSLAAYPQYRRVEVDGDGLHRVTDRRIGRLHRLSIGTITADSMVQVRFLRGGSLGSVEEGFITRLRPGDRFVFAGRLLALVRFREGVAYVRAATGSSTAVPRWTGGRLPVSGPLATAIRELLHQAADGCFDGPEMQAVRPCLEAQRHLSLLPRCDQLLVECIRSREGTHLFLYPFAGRLVHEGLAALLALRLSRLQPMTCRIAANDYGLEVLARELPEVNEALILQLCCDSDLEDDLTACLNASEMARHQFRDIARIAGLVFQGYPGAGRSGRQIQASSGLIYDVFSRHDPGNRLLHQTRRELLTGRLELERLRTALAAVRTSRLCICRPPRLTPMAFPLWAGRLQARFSSEDWLTRVRAMLDRVERATPA